MYAATKGAIIGPPRFVHRAVTRGPSSRHPRLAGAGAGNEERRSRVPIILLMPRVWVARRLPLASPHLPNLYTTPRVYSMSCGDPLTGN